MCRYGEVYLALGSNMSLVLLVGGGVHLYYAILSYILHTHISIVLLGSW